MKKIYGIIVVILLIIAAGCVYHIRNQKNLSEVKEMVSRQLSTELHHLDLRNKNLTSIPDLCASGLDQKILDDIWSIDLGNNSITKISVDLSCFKNLSELNLGYNQISEIEDIAQLKFLSKLDLSKNEIVAIEGLNELNRLQDLNLSYNKIESTKGLEGLENLISLQLQHNQLADVSAIIDLKNLETLKLEYNDLEDTDLQFLDSLTKLKHISTGDNQLSPEIIEKWNKKTQENMQK